MSTEYVLDRLTELTKGVIDRPCHEVPTSKQKLGTSYPDEQVTVQHRASMSSSYCAPAKDRYEVIGRIPASCRLSSAELWQ
jgi:hypothetical protein